MNDKMDLKISGSSTMPGGDYDHVRISGSGKIDGNLRASEISCSGAAEVRGNVEAESLNCSGACALRGNVDVKSVHSAGSLKVQGSFTSEEVQLHGSSKFLHGLHCKALKLAGGLVVEQDLEAENALLQGCVRIDGLLNAEAIDLNSNSISHIREIGCSRLRVRRENGSWLNRILHISSSYALKADSIEADQADLEYTCANVVRGRDFRIGPGCQIQRLEYTGICQAENGTVAELVKV